MSTLTIIDLSSSKELDSRAMAAVAGGSYVMPGFSLFNKVIDLDLAQAFGISTLASNGSVLNAAQGNVNLNGTQHAPQHTDVWQESYSYTEGVGNVSIGG